MAVSPREYRKELLALQRDIARELTMIRGGTVAVQSIERTLQRCFDLNYELEHALTRYVMKVGMR